MSRLNISGGIVAASLMLFGLPISAYALVDNPAGAVSQTPPSVIVFNQKPKGEEITVTYAFMPSAGNLVIYGSNHSGKHDAKTIGSVKLEAGDHHNIGVKLDKDVPAGTSLWASLTNSNQKSFWKASLPSANEFLIE
ncbi:hypothetical protein [Hyphomicrobium sp.]|jgi:hypothetical protein|uniref:DUF7282 domain-containing protein n=1 Tax=Hyphomicrobium sp. TaxID=82 RepID=UPI00356164AF